MSRAHKYLSFYERNDGVADGGVIQFVVKTLLESRDVSLTFVTRELGHFCRERNFLFGSILAEKKIESNKLRPNSRYAEKINGFFWVTRRIICVTTKLITTNLNIRKGITTLSWHVAFSDDILRAKAKNYFRYKSWNFPMRVKHIVEIALTLFYKLISEIYGADL